MVVEVDPVTDQAAGVLQGFEAVAMHVLLLERADPPIDQAVLLGTVRRDELLAQAVAPDQNGEVANGEDLELLFRKSLVRAQVGESKSKPHSRKRVRLFSFWLCPAIHAP